MSSNQEFETLPVIVPQRLRGQGFLSTDTATVLLPVNIWKETFKDYAGELDTRERALKFVTAIGEEPLEYDITRVDADHINKIGGEFVHVISEEDIIGSQILSQDGEEILTLVIKLIPLTAEERKAEAIAELGSVAFEIQWAELKNERLQSGTPIQFDRVKAAILEPLLRAGKHHETRKLMLLRINFILCADATKYPETLSFIDALPEILKYEV